MSCWSRFLPESSGGEQGTFGFIERRLGDLVVRRATSPSWPRPFLWFSTRMFGDAGGPERGVRYRGEPALAHRQLIDLAMVFVAGALFLAQRVRVLDARFLLQLLSWSSARCCFFVIFKFLPPCYMAIVWSRRCSARCFRVAKTPLRLYVGAVRDVRPRGFGREPDRLPAVHSLDLLHGLHVSAGGEVAETYDLMRMRRLQRVRLG